MLYSVYCKEQIPFIKRRVRGASVSNAPLLESVFSNYLESLMKSFSFNISFILNNYLLKNREAPQVRRSFLVFILSNWGRFSATGDGSPQSGTVLDNRGRFSAIGDGSLQSGTVLCNRGRFSTTENRPLLN